MDATAAGRSAKMDIHVVEQRETGAAAKSPVESTGSRTCTAAGKPCVSDAGIWTTNPIPAPVVPAAGPPTLPQRTTTESRSTMGSRLPLTVRGGSTRM
jgi:hypothetical protein